MTLLSTPTCTLCAGASAFYFEDQFRQYYQCNNCNCVFVKAEAFLSDVEEKARYDTHNNIVTDEGYQKFVNPIVQHVKDTFNTDQTGLDFGAGPGPVITYLLRKGAYRITTYDPFYEKNTAALDKKYDYIVCCEVIEHFQNPVKEFDMLFDMLLPSGQLICMTDLFYDAINFEKWYYKNDPTHLIFYHHNGLQYIKSHYGFKSVTVNNRLIVFEK